VVMGSRSDSRAKQALATTSVLSTSQPSGARAAQVSSKAPNPGMDLAASVLIGPAATRLTRTRSAPRSRARYLDNDSSAAFDTPIQSYAGQATVASKSSPTTDAPGRSSAPAATSMGRNASTRALSE